MPAHSNSAAAAPAVTTSRLERRRAARIRLAYATSRRTLDAIAMILLILGALNWGLVGVFDVDLVATVFDPMSDASRIVYGLIALAGLWGVVRFVHLSCER
jgi:uncharacterized membrane protein YuzA (DUF378 family)